MKRATILIATLSLLLPAGIASAKKAPETRHLETPAPIEASVIRGKVRYSLETGAALHISDLGMKVPAGEPEAMGRHALRQLATELGLVDADSGDLALRGVREGLSGTTVRFRQHVRGVPVLHAEIAITLDRNGLVRTVSSSYKPQVDELESRRAFAPTPVATAEGTALAYLGVEENSQVSARTDLVVVVHDGVARYSHRVRPIGAGRVDSFELMVDAIDGRLLRARDTNYYVDGSGPVFSPDPLSSATADYNDPGFPDNNDADSTELLAEIDTVTLRDITESSGTFSLTGPWAEVIDHDSPFKGLFSQNSSTWTGGRSDDSFEATNTYFHIDAYMRYLNDTLGLNIRPYQYATGVRFDPSGWGGADNSSYSSGTGRLSFGEGGVDDAEDADVVIHELGHGLHDWVTMGGLSQVNGLSEGVGDYAAVAYSRSFVGQWTPADPEYDWVFSWDGHNPFWGGRVTDWNDSNTYPDDLTGFSIHTDGQFWASCNIDVHEQIGAEKTDISFYEGLARTTSSTSHDSAAQAVLDATADIISAGGGAFGHTTADLQTFFDTYQGCGYTVTLPDVSTVFLDGFESGGVTAWSSSVGI